MLADNNILQYLRLLSSLNMIDKRDKATAEICLFQAMAGN